MNIALLTLLLLAVIPYVLSGLGGYFKSKQLGTIDNNHPRQQNRELSGIGARNLAAQENAWEALAFFSAALLACHLAAVPEADLTVPCLIIIAARILHVVAYLADQAVLRSTIFMAALVSGFYLFGLAVTV